MKDRIARIRHFNRVITRRLGALDGSFLGCGVSLGKARLLYEIANGTVVVQRLREKLALDSGHMSRMLRALETQGLIVTSAHPADARARVLKLTRAGKAKLHELERRTEEGLQDWLAPLRVPLQAELQAAMDQVVRILSASEIVLGPEDPGAEVAQGCLRQLFRELDERCRGGFDPGRAVPAAPGELRPPSGLFLLATTPERAVGCVGLELDERRGIGEVKHLWVSADVRGLGLGRRLLESVADRARRAGMRRLRLSTHRALTEAMALYRASGYREVPLLDRERRGHLAFEKRLA